MIVIKKNYKKKQLKSPKQRLSYEVGQDVGLRDKLLRVHCFRSKSLW